MANNKDFVKQCLKAHNEYRKNHDVPSLKLNDAITAKAQKWAQHMADSGDFKHCTERDFKGDTLGENIAMKWTSSGEEFTGKQVTDQWYSEIERYDFKNHQGSSAGHFSQVVWKSSKEFGIGRAKASDGKWLVVANYLPAGNFIGQHPENVFPPKNGVTQLKPAESEPKKDKLGKLNNGDVDTTGTASAGNTTTSTTRETTKETKNGVTYTKTITKETVTNPDGSKKVTTREVITTDKISAEDKVGEGDDDLKAAATTSNSTPQDRSEEAMEKFVNDCVTYHNKYRAKHGADDISHNGELSVMAQKWAENLSETNVLKHSDYKHKGDQLGENIASKWSSAGADYSGEDVVNQWYSESANYDFEANDFMKGTGHFTQVVWKNTRQIGLGKAFGKDGRVFVVVVYHPPGNVIGRFKDNVQAAKEE